MRLRLLFALVLASVAAVAAAALLVAVNSNASPSSAGFWGILAIGSAALVGWLVLERRVAAPLRILRRQARTLAETTDAPPIGMAAKGPLAPLLGAIARLAVALTRARREMAEAVALATARGALEKSRLSAVLRDLGEGVLVCSRDHRVLLYNEAALRVLGAPPQLGLGRSLFEFLAREPVLHALERLEQHHPDEAATEANQVIDFVGAATPGGALLEGRMTLIRDSGERALGYVLSFADVSGRIEQLASRERLIQASLERLRGPLASLRAAAETIAAHPDLPPEEINRFQDVVLQESAALAERLQSLATEHSRISGPAWPAQRLHSADLMASMMRAAGQLGLEVIPVGLPLWLQGDSHLMLLVTQELLRQMKEVSPAPYEAEMLLSDRRAYLDLSWQGEAIPQHVLERWLEAPLPGLIGGGSLRDALERLAGAALWSQRDGAARARLRLPLGTALPPQERPELRRALPPRPEFYDFDLLDQAGRAARQDERPLREVDFVVFDTETTGLRPSEGDEVVSLAGVRVVNGRLLSGETFERLVNPRRPIPQESVRFHRITDAEVRGMPALVEIMPDFKAFVGDAVLVGHNVAFDLKFLRLKERQAGVRFDNPVLDTLLLSRLLDPEVEDHSLEAVAQRHSLEAARRHTAIGDALVTAAILIRQIKQLEARGITSLAEAVRQSDTAAEVKRLQAQF